MACYIARRNRSYLGGIKLNDCNQILPRTVEISLNLSEEFHFFRLTFLIFIHIIKPLIWDLKCNTLQS